MLGVKYSYQYMEKYLLTAAGVIFLSVIVSLIIPEGKLNKTITFVIRLICILVLIQPITGIFKISSAWSGGDFFDYEYVCAEYSEHQSSQLELLLLDEFDVETVCSVKVMYQDAQFKVDSVEVWVNGQDTDFIEKIYAYLQEIGYINITVYAKSS